jgi:hypothetical protein
VKETLAANLRSDSFSPRAGALGHVLVMNQGQHGADHEVHKAERRQKYRQSPVCRGFEHVQKYSRHLQQKADEQPGSNRLNSHRAAGKLHRDPTHSSMFAAEDQLEPLLCWSVARWETGQSVPTGAYLKALNELSVKLKSKRKPGIELVLVFGEGASRSGAGVWAGRKRRSRRCGDMIQQRKRRQKAITVAAYRQKHPTCGRALYRLRIDRRLCKGESSGNLEQMRSPTAGSRKSASIPLCVRPTWAFRFIVPF